MPRLVWIALLSGAVGCPNVDSLGPPRVTAAMYVSDFRTDFGSDPILDYTGAPSGSELDASLAMRVFIGGTVDDYDAVLDAAAGGLWLVSLETGAQIDGEGVVGLVSVAGVPRRNPEPPGGFLVSFVPTAPLADGWYVLAGDRTAVTMPRGDGATMESDIAFARFHIGSRPMWRSTEVSCVGPSCRVTLALSEAVEDLRTTEVTVSRDGVALACRDAMFRSSWSIVLDCELEASTGEVVVAMVSDVIETPDGSTSHRLTLPRSRMLVSPRFGIDAVIAAR